LLVIAVVPGAPLGCRCGWLSWLYLMMNMCSDT
jgi:hypothetical protein